MRDRVGCVHIFVVLTMFPTRATELWRSYKKLQNYTLFARFIGSLMRIQYPKPRYDPFLFSIISPQLLKELHVTF